MSQPRRRDSLGVQIAFFTFVRMLCSTGFRMVYPFLPVFRDALGVSIETLSAAIGSRSLVAAFVGPFFASLGDSRGRRTGMLIGMGLFVSGALAVTLLPTFLGFLVALVLMVIGKVTFDPSMQAYIGDRIPYARRSLAITVTEASWSGAFILGIPAIGWIIGRFGWLAPFQVLGLLVLACAAFLLLLLPRDPAHVSKPPKLSASFKLISKSPAARAVLLFTLFTCIANEVIGLIFGVWLEASFGLQITALGLAAAVLGVAELSGEGLVAVITDRLGKRRSIILGTLVNCVACLALPFMNGSYFGALLALFFFYISFEFTIVSSIPLMTEVVPSARATMMSGFFTFASIGRAAASWITPALFSLGFGFNAAAAVLFNLAALLCLRNLRLETEA